MTFSLKKYKRARIVFLVAFVVLTLVLVSAWILVPKIRSYTVYTVHEPIRIDGDQGFVQENGVARGSGSESDHYVIEGWSLSCTATTKPFRRLSGHRD